MARPRKKKPMNFTGPTSVSSIDCCGPPRKPAVPSTSKPLPSGVGHDVARSAATEIRKLAEACEKDPNDPRAFLMIEKFASMARDVVAMTGTIDASLGTNPLLGPPSVSNYLLPGYSAAAPLAPSPGSETFGATSIREIVSAMSRKKPEDIVAAIAEAEKNGMFDLAAELREQLGLPSKTSAAKEPSASRKPKKGKRSRGR
jgi:hypothetical protein